MIYGIYLADCAVCAGGCLIYADNCAVYFAGGAVYIDICGKIKKARVV